MLSEQNKKSLLSVIMPVYNAEKYIEQAIQSIINQTYQFWELYIIDDSSKDESFEIIQKFKSNDSRVKIFKNETNLGKVETLKKYFHLLSGQYIVFHDADDISSPNRFEKQVNFLDNNKDYGLIGTGFTIFDEKNKIIDSTYTSISDDEIRLNAKSSSQFHFPTCMFRSSVLANFNPLFREYFKNNNEDTDLAYRVLNISKGYNFPEPLYLYRVLGNSISRNNLFRNSYVYYKIVRDLFYQREKGLVDALESGEIEKLEKEYAELLNDKKLIYYANAVSFNLSYYMIKRAFKVVYFAFQNLSIIESTKLLIVTCFKSSVLSIKYLTLKKIKN
jgi:glycosyltransferase involved in cell wall biosynthesis